MNENLQIRKKKFVESETNFFQDCTCIVQYITVLETKKTVSFSLKFEYFKGMFEK